MIELVDERGYGAVTVHELAERAGVSTRSFYQCFKGKQDCLLDTYEEITRATARAFLVAREGEPDGRRSLELGFGALARELARDPAAARLALVEVYGAGLATLERRSRVLAKFEAMLGRCLATPAGEAEVPPLLVKGITAGLLRVMRARVVSGRERELPTLSAELVGWALCFRGAAAASLSRAAGDVPPLPVANEIGLDAGVDGEPRSIERGLLLSAAASLAAREGYWHLSGSRICAAAGLSPRIFARHFDSIEACFLATLELLTENLIADAEGQGAHTSSWPRGVHRAVTTLCQHCAADPALARLAFVEIIAPGAVGVRCRVSLIGAIAERFRASAPSSLRPAPLVAEASIGAIWGVMHHQVASGRTEQLPAIAPALSFLALAPVLGPDLAARAIAAESACSRSEGLAASIRSALC
ncbi:MAG: TetR/AcrR family transcriptional regulator [Solirubrobacterales bacterium]|nr:TetR/AcrR family transcriptional regulator [Solirubrobacterales bacterium]